MRCDCCPLSDPEDTCPEADGKYGINHKDGVLGCSHPWNWVNKRDMEYCEYLGNMGTDMGIEMDLTKEELSLAIEICKHMVGLDYKNPYHRHGKVFYKPYRNYYAAPLDGDKVLDKLPNYIVKKTQGELSIRYELTRSGMEWLGRQLNITIKEIGE